MDEKLHCGKRAKPWTMDTIGEVIECMNKLKEQCDFHDDTPIWWYHLERGDLSGQVIESHIPIYHDTGKCVEITLKEIGTDCEGFEED